MLTDNFYRLISCDLGKVTASTSYSPVILPDGKASAVYYNVNGAFQHFNGSSVRWEMSGNGVIVGRGTTPPSRKDYKLEDQITEGLTYAGASKTVSNGNERLEIVFTVTLINTSDAPITISEIGYLTQFNSASSTIKYALFDRTVLDDPITIPAGDSKAINYSICINWPT